MSQASVRDAVLLERRGSIAIVTMNAPQKRNALTAALYSQLSEVITALQDDETVRALVLEGGAHFCSGGDLSGLELSPLEMRTAMQVGHRIVRGLIGGRLPAVAAVQGNAYGAGFSLALACDFIVGDADTTFCASFGRVGLVPDYGLLWSLPQRVSVAVAREIIMLCEPLRAPRARELGLIDRMVERGEVLTASIALAERLALAPPGTIATSKAALARVPMTLDTMLAWEADTQSLLVCSDDLKEGIEAFRQKRDPQFKGR